MPSTRMTTKEPSLNSSQILDHGHGELPPQALTRVCFCIEGALSPLAHDVAGLRACRVHVILAVLGVEDFNVHLEFEDDSAGGSHPVASQVSGSPRIDLISPVLVPAAHL